MINRIILHLRARDFAGAVFMSNECCAIANAANHHFDTRSAMEYCTELYVKNRKFLHDHYWESEFESDLKIAHQRNFDASTIRELTLIEIYD